MKILRIVLTLAFAWSIFKGVEILFRPTSMDRFLFDHLGLSWLFWILVPSILVLLGGSLVYLWQPSRFGYRIAQAAVLAHMLESLLGGIFGMQNPSIAREAFIASREGRGLPVRQEVLDMMAHPAMHVVVIAFSIFVSVVLLVLLFFFEKTRKTQSQEDGHE